MTPASPIVSPPADASARRAAESSARRAAESSARRAAVGALRQTLRRLETAGLESGEEPLPFGIAEIDGLLGGGLARGALHELAAPREPEIGAATGFALALAR